MISFACLVPHSPLLIPEVGQDHLSQLADTKRAYQHLEQELYVAKPDILIIISPHKERRPGAFTINQRPKIKLDFKEFGDLVTDLEFTNAVGFGYKIKESCEHYFPIVLTAEEKLNYGSGVPLYYLAKNLPDIKIVSLSYADLSVEDHLKFGEIIKKQINLSSQRIAVIASGDLSHCLHQDSPAGFSPRGQEFDQKIIKLLNEKNFEGLIKLDPELIKESGACGYRSLLILMGIIKDLNYEPEKLSYEAPFGIGYLVENFKLK
jgi:aromatic ring-opening dioxygenase LigB subunit